MEKRESGGICATQEQENYYISLKTSSKTRAE
jgi:hypothetical protein